MGLTFDKILVILVIALIIVGPERLPGYAKKLGEFVKTLRRMADGAKDRLRDEMGPEFDDVDWKKLDPRQYDPRRIIRDALVEDEAAAADASHSGAASSTGSSSNGSGLDGVVPGGSAVNRTQQRASRNSTTDTVMNFDEEAT